MACTDHARCPKPVPVPVHVPVPRSPIVWLTSARAERIEITRDIAASPEAVYAAISDVTRMGEWSEECHTCAWHDGFDGPTVGAMFDGHNRNGAHEWTSQGKVIEADPGRSFTFEVSMMDIHYATWGCRIVLASRERVAGAGCLIRR